MKKSKLLVVGLIALLLAGGLFLAGCDIAATVTGNGTVKVYNAPDILNTYDTATITVNYASRDALLDSDYFLFINVGSAVSTSQALGLGSIVTVPNLPTGVGLCVRIDDHHIVPATGKSSVSNSDRFVLADGQTITLTYDGFFIEID